MGFFLKHLRATRGGVLFMLVMQGALFLAGVVIVLGINAFLNEDRDYAVIGSLMALMGIVFGGLLRGSGGMIRYRMAISMGYTRRAYILADPVITAMNCLIGIAFALLLNKLELWLYSRLYPGWEMEFDIMSRMKWWYFLILIAGVCALDFCLGAVQIRFGSKGFAAIWFPLCFAPTIIVNCVNAAQGGSGSLLARIGQGVLFLVGLLTPAMWAAVGVAILLVLLALSTMCYRSMEVRM